MSISISTAFKSKISIPFGQLKSVVQWCTDNCKDDWRFTEEDNTYTTSLPSYDFYFESEHDYINFTLWLK